MNSSKIIVQIVDLLLVFQRFIIVWSYFNFSQNYD